MGRAAQRIFIALALSGCDGDVRPGPTDTPPPPPPAPPSAPAIDPPPFTVDWPLDRSDLLGADHIRIRGRAEPGVSVTIGGELAQTEGDGWWLELPLPPGQGLSLRVSGLRDHRFWHRDLTLHNTLPVGSFRGAAALGEALLLLQEGHLLRVDPRLGVARRITPRRAITHHPLDEIMVDVATSRERLFVLTEDALYTGVDGSEELRRLFRLAAERKGRQVHAAPGGGRLGLVLGEDAVFEHEVESGALRLHLPPPRSAMALTDDATWFADGAQLYRGANGGGAPLPWMPLPLSERPAHLLVSDDQRLALVDGTDLVLIDPTTKRCDRVRLEFAPRTRGVFFDGRFWASARVGGGPDELMAFDPETGVAETRIGASPSPSMGLFASFAHDGRPRAGVGAALRGEELLFPRSEQAAMLRWDLTEARFDRLTLPDGGPHLPFVDQRELVLAGGERAWLWRPDEGSLARAPFGDECAPLRRAVAVKDHWVGLCGEDEVIVRASSALESERFGFEGPIRGLAAGEGNRVWLADADQIFEWDVERFITLRVRRLPPGAPTPTAVVADGERLRVGLGGGVLGFDAEGRPGVISPPPPFESRPVELFVEPGRGLLFMVDAAQRGVFAVDQRTGARALVLR